MLQIEDLDRVEITANLDGLSFLLEKLQAAQKKIILWNFGTNMAVPSFFL
jgi:hypothetical protein